MDVNLNDALIAALRRGDIDFSLNALPSSLPDELQVTPLISDDLCLVVREGHPLLAKRRLRLADLAGAAWMLPGPEVAARRSVEARLVAAGLPPPRVVVEVGNTAAAADRAAAGQRPDRTDERIVAGVAAQPRRGGIADGRRAL